MFSYFYSNNKKIVYIFTFAGLGHIFSSIARKNLIGFMRYWLIHIIIFIFLRGDNIWTTFETEEDRQTILSISNLSKINAILINGTGVDLNLFYPFYSNKNKPFNVLFAGRMLRSKGIIQYLEVSKILASSDFVFKIAGWEYQSPDGLSPSELKLLIDSPTVDFLGFVDDMATLLRSVDAVVLPSSYPEGIPKIFLEAAASGLPIISTDFPGARRVIEDGVTGIIISAPTVEQIADAVLSIYNQPDLGRAMGEKAHRFIHDGNFSEADIQKQFIAVFERAQLGDN
ncbi:MAG: glycosyltransferase [Gammaproteobacteria bacterium]|nr:glycosyltransferase [Gammaproteobacteria bacterium]